MFFSFGVIGTRYNINKFHKYLYLLVGLLGSLLLLLIYNQPGTNTWYENYLFVCFLILISNLSFFCILIRTVKAIRFTGKIAKFFEIFSYSSFCIFLLHRPIWSIMAVIYPEVSTSKPLSLEPILQYLYIVFLGVPIIVLCSYLIQSNYNSLLNYLSKGHKL
jgi:peptidoglycan/LPS O-acetylase OafA/YrhL